MSSVQVRDVPEPIVDVLRGEAARRGQSLRGYLLDVLVEQAHRAAATSVFDDVAAHLRVGGSREFDSVGLVRAERDGRESELLERARGAEAR